MNTQTPCFRLSEKVKVWKTIKLGTGLKAADEFWDAITKTGRACGLRAHDVLSHPSFTVSDVEMEVDLVQVTALDLGFHMTKDENNGLERAELREVFIRRAVSYGYKLCPTEVAPQLRIQGEDEDYCMIATERLPFSSDDGKGYATLGLGIMGSEIGQRPTLAAYAEDWMLPNLKWVFIKPRK